MRFVRAARREVELYERNREAVFDLGDDGLRFRLHDLMIRLAIPLDFLMDESQDLGGDIDRHTAVMAETLEVFRRHCDEIQPMIERLRRSI